jgi:hypothetical protein
MQFYPHNINVTTIGFAVSASIANSGSLINNFAAIAINRVATASFGLNITGSSGANGTGAVVSGPTGAQGDRGVTGFRGRSVFLLSGSWNTGTCSTPPVNCYSYDFASVSEIAGDYFCNYGELTTYYSTDSTLAVGSPMFYNSTCTAAMNGVSPIGAYNLDASRVLETTSGVNTLSIVASCTEDL